MFKGYIITKNKKSIEVIKNRNNFKTYEGVKEHDEFAGVLAEDTILVDIDNKKESDILLKLVEDRKLQCVVYETNRGKHFYFKNRKLNKNSTGTKLVIGLTADIKVGLKNSYAILKYNNKIRKKLYSTEVVEEIPYFLLPTDKEINVIGLKNGENRNTTLFTYIPKLQYENFSNNEIRYILTIINNYRFNVPLPQKELETILRDSAFELPKFFEKNKFKHDVFSKYIMFNFNIKTINGQLHIYKNGVYKSDYKIIERKMTDILPDLTDNKRKEVFKYLELICEDYKISDSNLVAFKNGIYDISKDELTSFTPEIVLTNLIPWNFNKNAYSKIADDFLNDVSCNDKSIRSLL